MEELRIPVGQECLHFGKIGHLFTTFRSRGVWPFRRTVVVCDGCRHEWDVLTGERVGKWRLW